MLSYEILMFFRYFGMCFAVSFREKRKILTPSGEDAMKKTHLYIAIRVWITCVSLIAGAGSVVAEGHRSEFAEAVALVKQKEYSSAYLIFDKLAQDHDHDAQFNAAIMLKKGMGHPANYKSALKWSWLAELGGISKATELRDDLTSLVPEETQDQVRAEILQILQKRLDEGDKDVILQLAQYHISVAAEVDYQNAYALRALAAALNVKNAFELRNDVEGN